MATDVMDVTTWNKQDCEWMLSKDISDSLRSEVEKQLGRIVRTIRTKWN